MKNIEVFRKYLDMLSDDELRQIVESYLLNGVPEYFWVIGEDGFVAPEFTKGYGGLVRHTMTVTEIAIQLFNKPPYHFNDFERDVVITACLIHDTVKYGIEHDDRIYEDMFRMLYKGYAKHGENVAEYFKKFVKDNYNYVVDENLSLAVRFHASAVYPSTRIAQCVYDANYLANLSVAEYPEIQNEYDRVMHSYLTSLRFAAVLCAEEDFEVHDVVNFKKTNNGEVIFEHYDEIYSVNKSWILFSEQSKHLLLDGTVLLTQNIAKMLPDKVNVSIEDIQMVQVNTGMRRVGVVSLCI